MINIITSFYICKLKEKNVNERNEELVESLKKNIESQYVEQIHLFVDDDESLLRIENLFGNYISNEKIIIINNGKQPLYSDFFDYANNNLKNKICMITNSDIYLHSVDKNLIYYLRQKSNILYALTRHEYDMSCKLINRYQGSHDCFIFNSPLITKNFIENIQFTQNNWGSEAKVLQELYKNGVKIYNPCRQIIIVHLHKSEVREEERIWVSKHSYDDPGSHHPPVHISVEN